VELIFREAMPSDVGELFSVRARTRENPISSEQLAELRITPEVIAGQVASGRIKGRVCLPWCEAISSPVPNSQVARNSMVFIEAVRGD